MIAVVIVGILAAIALPSYSKQIVKGNRSAAQAMLMNVAQKEQQILIDSRSYTAVADCAGMSAIGVAVDKKVSDNYRCTVTVSNTATPPTFTATATPYSSRQSSDGALTIDQSGAKTPTDKW